MGTIVVKAFRFRFWMCVALLAILALQFWTTSRYPSLNEKAMMSGAFQLEDPLSFDAWMTLRPEDPVGQRILVTTVNWIETNQQGMTFGVLFGAALLTLFGYLSRTSFKGSFANAFAGLGIGAPLGVCVNCAAPIARAMYNGGARLETTMAAMIASPTLNVIVLTMLFSLLPLYMALAKLALSFIVILLLVPLIAWLLPRDLLEVEPKLRVASPLPAPTAAGWDEPLKDAVFRFARDYLSNLFFIVTRTVPLMLLAGFLGAIVATLLPADLLNDVSFSLPAVLIVAAVGIFLPVPIGFDVVTSSAMLAAGLSPGFVMTLLFALGVFSVYSYMILAGAVSIRAASLLAGALIIVSAVAGIFAHHYEQNATNRALELLTGFHQVIIPPAQAAGLTDAIVDQQFGDARITVSSRPHFPPASAGQPVGEKTFTRREAWHLGIDQPVEFSIDYMWPPFWEGRSIAATDFDRDGDPDIIIASTRVGMYVYVNDGTGQFSRSGEGLASFVNMPVFNIVPADFDNDGWPDLFVTTYQAGNFIVYNRAGTFDMDNALPVRNRDDAILTLAVAIADIDGNGYLDIIKGNWAAGWYRRIPSEEARNRIVFNSNGRPDGSEHFDLPGLPGETLSVLVSDIDDDGHADMVIANDFELPDYVYFGRKGGGFTLSQRDDGRIPMTTTTTMAVKSADLHNDGSKEIYFAQIAGRSSGISERLKLQPLERYCDLVEREDDLETCQTNMTIKAWYRTGNNFNPDFAQKCFELSASRQATCKAMLIKDLAIQNRDPQICALIPTDQQLPRQYCDIHFKPGQELTEGDMAQTIPQILRRNVLLAAQPDGTFQERAEEENLEVGGWSWDVKIADFDQDGFQDVLIVNGTWVPNEVSPSNIFLRNRGDGTFEEQTEANGLIDYAITAAAVRVDIDLDGDLDLITVPVNAPVSAFINTQELSNAVTVELEDFKANRFGIGAEVSLSVAVADGDDLVMRREIQKGGGFMSFDAPIAHFGLGKNNSAQSLSIRWPDGDKTTIDTPITAGNHFKVTRQ